MGSEADEGETMSQPAVHTGVRLRSGTPAFHELSDFLVDEAWLLDDGRLSDWLDLLADDVRYFMPTRATVLRDEGLGFDPAMGHFEETRASLAVRVRRLAESPSAWTENPASRTRHFLTNVAAWESEVQGEFTVRSACLVLRNRMDSPNFNTLSMSRDDVLRRTADGFQIARRTIFMDASTLDSANLSILF